MNIDVDSQAVGDYLETATTRILEVMTISILGQILYMLRSDTNVLRQNIWELIAQKYV